MTPELLGEDLPHKIQVTHESNTIASSSNSVTQVTHSPGTFESTSSEQLACINIQACLIACAILATKH